MSTKYLSRIQTRKKKTQMSNSTTSEGVCPVVGGERCSDFCDSLQICSSLERGQCEIVLGTTPVIRSIFSYDFKIQNCSRSELTINEVTLSLLNRVKFIRPDESEGIVNSISAINEVPPPGTPFWKRLVLSSTCGIANEDLYTGFFTTNLVKGPFLLDSGECCFSLVFAVDSLKSDNLTILLESPVLCVSGVQVSGNQCCRFERSLVASGECRLRYVRNSHVQQM